jgi:AcrR family transcriptional regulator
MRRPGPEGGKRDQNRKQRTQVLKTAALALYLERGTGGVTIDDIVAKAGVAKGSFYRYFQDSQDLVRALLEPVATTLGEAFSRCEDALRKARTQGELTMAYLLLAKNLTHAVREHPGVVRLYLQESRAPAVGARAPLIELASEVRRSALVLTHAGHSHGLLRDIDPRVSGMAVIGAIEELLFGYLAGQDRAEPQHFARGLIDLVLDGIRQRT